VSYADSVVTEETRKWRGNLSSDLPQFMYFQDDSAINRFLVSTNKQYILWVEEEEGWCCIAQAHIAKKV